jgi:MFS family permease
MGLRPDGDTSLVNSPGAAAQSGGFTLREALRTRAFLLLLFAFVMNQITGSSLTFSMLPILQERGLTAGQAVAVLSVWGFATVPGVLLAGYLRDRWPLRKVMVWTFGGTTVGFAVLFVTNNPWTGMLFAVVYGVPFAASIMMQTLAFADVFGPQSLGAIRGFTQPFLMGFNALAPLGASLLFDITGGYGPVLASYMVFSAAATLAVWGLRLPVAAQARAG